MKIYKPNKLIIDNLKYNSKKQVIVYDIFLNNNFIYLIFNPNYISKEELQEFNFYQNINNNFEICNYVETIIDGERLLKDTPAGGEGCGILKYEYKSDDFIFKYKNYTLTGKIQNLNNYINGKITISTLVHGPNYKFLKNWINYHNLLGVDSFVIYLNDYFEQDPKEVYLDNLINTDKYNILFIDWNTYTYFDGFANKYSFHSAQPESLNHCFYSLNSKHHIFIDVDEYIVLKTDKNFIDLIEKYKDHGQLLLFNRWCGSNFKNIDDIIFNNVFCSDECLDEDKARLKIIIINKDSYDLIFVHGNRCKLSHNFIELDWWKIAELRHYIDFNEDERKRTNIYSKRLINTIIEKGLLNENNNLGS
jgi:hypothetical protein